MNSKNSKTSELHRLLLSLADKTDLKRSDQYIALSNLSMLYLWKNIKYSYESNQIEISHPTWNEKFELPDGSGSVSDIQNYFRSRKICW